MPRRQGPEARISREVQKFLKMIGGEVYSLEQGYRKERGGTRQTPGLPDLFVMFPAEQVWTWAELKGPKGKLTMHQLGFQMSCKEAGIPHEVWRDVRDAWEWARESGLIEEVN